MDAWQEGYEAYWLGGPLNGNPYEGEEANLWDAGWHQGLWEDGAIVAQGFGGDSMMSSCISPGQEGYDSYYEGVPLCDNPYRGYDYDEWAEGWLHARDEEGAIADMEGLAMGLGYGE